MSSCRPGISTTTCRTSAVGTLGRLDAEIFAGGVEVENGVALETMAAALFSVRRKRIRGCWAWASQVWRARRNLLRIPISDFHFMPITDSRACRSPWSERVGALENLL